MISTDTPFVLLDDARLEGAAPARYYSDPLDTLTAHSIVDIPTLLAGLRNAKAKGLHAAGYLAYEAGFALEESVGSLPDMNGKPLGWFGIFDQYQEVRCDAITSWLRPPEGAYLSPFRSELKRSEYAKAFARVQHYIEAGDIYQANLTFRAYAQYAGNPLALYAAIRPNAAAGYGGIVWTGDNWHLSFSPELFFALKSGRVTTKPMKGTAIRETDPARDARAAEELRCDPKQRAENLMIVDLLRNDLSRICDAGSVQVPDLFRVESYPTVHQMTSTVTGEMTERHDATDLLGAIFPCGSITGAPKIRAMQIIEEIEQSARGAYCGSIGRIDANGDAAFNVAIRTFSLFEEQKQVSLGLGSGIVADSDEAGEWAECLAKGNFAKMHRRGFDLIETMRFEPAHGILRLELHLERLKDSARALDFEFDRHAARNQLHAVTFHLEQPAKIRLLLSQSGAIAMETRVAPVDPSGPWRVKLVPLPVDPGDFRLVHKTSDRAFYDDARQAAVDVDEVVFVDTKGRLTEGSFTSMFVKRGDKLLTPPSVLGLLPSVLRRELIESGKAVETELHAGDLADGLLLGNSLRGLIAAKRVA